MRYAVELVSSSIRNNSACFIGIEAPIEIEGAAMPLLPASHFNPLRYKFSQHARLSGDAFASCAQRKKTGAIDVGFEYSGGLAYRLMNRLLPSQPLA